MFKLLKNKKFVIAVAILAGLWILAYLGTLGYAAISAKKGAKKKGESVKEESGSTNVSSSAPRNTSPQRYPLCKGSNDKYYTNSTAVGTLQQIIRNAQTKTGRIINGKAKIAKDGIWGNDTEKGMEFLRRVYYRNSYNSVIYPYKTHITYSPEKGHSVADTNRFNSIVRANNDTLTDGHFTVNLQYGEAQTSSGSNTLHADPESMTD